MNAFAPPSDARHIGSASASRRVAHTVLAYARGRVDAYLQAREARKAYRQVMAMSDHQLRDIGLSRSDVKARVFGPASRPKSIL